MNNQAFISSVNSPEDLKDWVQIVGGTLAVAGGVALLAGCTLASAGVCGVIVAGGYLGSVALSSVTVFEAADNLGVFDPQTTTPDYIFDATNPGNCDFSVPGSYTCIPSHVAELQAQNFVDLSAKLNKTQDKLFSESGLYLSSDNGNGQSQEIHEGQVPYGNIDLSKIEPVRHAKESGGVNGTVTTEYSETSITQGQEFSTSESWSEATAVDSAHAADLRFTYRILNDGTDILREMDGLLFNIYLGADPNPIYTYNVIAQTGSISNLQPEQERTFASNPVPLTLQQMAKIDQGEQLFITVEQLSYGGDQVFFEDAVNGGLIVGIEDGWQDGDDVLDLYVLPCFGSPCGVDPNESIQTIVQRGFPTREDDGGNMLAISTPEVNGTQVNWTEHSLAYNSWWNVYFSNNIQYTGAVSTTLPLAGEAAVFRFLTDTDLDGFNDRTEERLATDPDDAGSHPTAELLAGAVTERKGNDATIRMAFLNSGIYDAAGVEVVAYAPDDSITLVDNVIGGSGRVSAGNRVVLGGRIRPPVLGTGWSSTAVPQIGGQYTGTSTKTYTFTAAASGSIGSGSLIFNWNDGTDSGQLQFGAGYYSPTPLPVGADGLQVGFNTGNITTGNSFTVQVSPAGDTIRYAINSEPFNPPVLVVSYNDPQGNHRFITPIVLDDVAQDLHEFSGQMIPDLGLSITTTGPFDPSGSNTTYYVTNSPDSTPIQDAHLFIEYINAAGTAASEQELTQDLQPGPTVWPVTWDASVFNEPFTKAEDYNILAYWTDGQGNIIDTAVRPLESFQEDPLPRVETSGLSWNFGSVTKGTLLTMDIPVANIGVTPLFAHATSSDPALTSSFLNVFPGSFRNLRLKLDTALLNPGPISVTIDMRTNDPNTTTQTISVSGTVTPFEDGEILANNLDIFRPYDQYVYIQGPASSPVSFTPDLEMDVHQMHPIKVFDQKQQRLLGLGEHALCLDNGMICDDVYPMEEFQAITTKGAMDWEHITIGFDHYLAVANYHDSSGYNIASKIYKWNGSNFLEHQTIGTSGAMDWEHFVIDSVHYLAVANSLDGTTHDLYSKIYRWNGINFVEAQSIFTYGACDWEYLSIGSDHYLVVTNGDSSLHANMGFKIYHWNGSSFIEIQTISIYWPTDTEHFVIGTNHYLALAISFNGSSRAVDSKLYQWNGSSFVEFQTIPTYGAMDWEHFTIENEQFLAVANSGDYWPSANSKIYRWNGNSFLEFQSIPTYAAWDWKYYKVGGHNFLAVAHERYFNDKNTNSNIYTWNGSNFEVFQELPTHGASDWEHFTIGGYDYLAVANQTNGSSETIDSIIFSARQCFFITKQSSISPYDETQLILSDALGSGQSIRYLFQYGQRKTFSSSGTQVYSFIIPKRTYTEFTLDILFEQMYSQSFSFSLDLGSNGSVDWQDIGNQTSTLISSPNLSTALNTYLSSRPEAWDQMIEVPISLIVNSGGDAFLTNLVLTPASDSDPYLSNSDISFDNPDPMESQVVNLSALVHNQGHFNAKDVVTTFFAGDPSNGGIYLGSDFIASIPINGTALAQSSYNTTGFAGNVEIYVLLDASEQIAELNESNNSAQKTLIIRTRPDLRVSSIVPSPSETKQGNEVSLDITVQNIGQTSASSVSIALYAGTVLTGTLIDLATVPIIASSSVNVPMHWNATGLGSQTLSVFADYDDQVNESIEDNNQSETSVLVGWGEPLYIDAAYTNDLAYDPTNGYGYLTAGTAITSCGTQPHQTYRQRNSGEQLQYRFDHLLPSHFYHLDLSFFLCSGTRNLRILVDGFELVNPITASILPNYQTFLLDPSLYADRSIIVTIEKVGGGLGGPVVSELKLTDIRYCYRDSGSPGELPFIDAPDGCGWIDGMSDNGWGSMPFQTVRYDEGSSVQYRYDGLETSKLYNVNLTFFENDSGGRIENVIVDGTTVLNDIALSSTAQKLSAEIPPEKYIDGSVLIEISDSTLNQPVISEISVEEKNTLQPMMHSVSGHVQDGSSNPISGVTVSDGQGHSTSTNASGDYTLSGLPPGTYTLTPTKTGYSFTPTNQQVTVPPNATNVNFTGSLITYSVNGHVQDGSSNPIAGVTISDGQGHSTSTNDSGDYTLSGLPPGTYTLTPTKTGYSFTPITRQVTLPPNATNVNFTGSLITYSVSGHVQDGSSNPLSGVTISDGQGHSTSTNASGDYTLGSLPPGTYTLTPTKTGYSFTPTNQQVTLPPNGTNVNFTGSLITYSVSGHVQDGSSNPISGVTISDGLGHLTITDANGDYTLSGLPPGTYTLTPSKSGYSFSPASQQVTLPPSATNVNFTGSLITYSVSGHVQDGSSNPISGVTISDGQGHSTSTNASGDYTLSSLPPGSYTLTPSKSGYSFSPTTHQVTLPPSATSVNFTGSLITYSVSGHVQDGSANPLSGVTISDGLGHSTTTNASGDYTLSSLPPGSYTLTPSKSGYIFTPTTQQVTLPPNATIINFIGVTIPEPNKIYLPIVVRE